MSLIRWIVRKGVLPDNWPGSILGRKPRMVAAVALANKMARIIWVMKGSRITEWRDPQPFSKGNVVTPGVTSPGGKID